MAEQEEEEFLSFSKYISVISSSFSLISTISVIAFSLTVITLSTIVTSTLLSSDCLSKVFLLGSAVFSRSITSTSIVFSNRLSLLGVINGEQIISAISSLACISVIS